MKKYPFNPDYAVPPGATIKETLKAKNMTQANFAKRMGMSQKSVSQIIHGKARITYQTAEKLETVLGICTYFWINAETNYRMALRKAKPCST